jgi:hypothetical protein
MGAVHRLDGGSSGTKAVGLRYSRPLLRSSLRGRVSPESSEGLLIIEQGASSAGACLQALQPE